MSDARDLAKTCKPSAKKAQQLQISWFWPQQKMQMVTQTTYWICLQLDNSEIWTRMCNELHTFDPFWVGVF